MLAAALVMPEHTNLPSQCLLSHIVSLPCINPLSAVDSRCCLTLDTLRLFMSVSSLFRSFVYPDPALQLLLDPVSNYSLSHGRRILSPSGIGDVPYPHIFPHPHDIRDRSCDMGISKRIFSFGGEKAGKYPSCYHLFTYVARLLQAVEAFCL